MWEGKAGAGPVQLMPKPHVRCGDVLSVREERRDGEVGEGRLEVACCAGSAEGAMFFASFRGR